MILLLDVGNQRLKWVGDDRVGECPAQVRAWRGHDWNELLDSEWADTEPTRILASNVAGPEAQSAIAQYCRGRWGQAVEWLESSAECAGLTSAYEQPTSLGNDRWAAMLGALDQCEGPALVIDCGTAVTVDLVDTTGRHLGGAIFPGLRTMRDSLGRSTANLFSVEIEATAFSGNTIEAIAGGTAEALVGAIERYCQLAEQRFGRSPDRFLCGGDADLVMRRSRLEFRHLPNLVMLGLLRGLL